jgi:hypothetical protein
VTSRPPLSLNASWGDIRKLSTVFESGSCRFTISGRDEALLEQLSGMFAGAGESVGEPVIDIEIDPKYSIDQIGNAIRQIVVSVIAQHAQHLYVEGAAILNRANELILLVGTTRAGKSTLSAALALGLGWRILTEDLVIFDLSNKYILPLNFPISLRPGAKELIEAAIGSRVDTKGKSDVWMPIESKESRIKREGRFDKVILLEAPNGKGIACFDLIPEQALRLILPASNAIYSDHGIDDLMEMIKGARCVRLTGGSVKERVDAIERT